MATFTLLTTLSSTADQSVYTWASTSLGDAASGRCLILAVNSRAGVGNGTDLTSISVGGVNATLIGEVVTANGGPSASSGSSIYAINVPTGTTADIVATFVATQLRAAVNVLRSVGVDASRVTDTGTIANASGSPRTFTLTNAAGDLVVATAGNDGSSTATWADITEQSDAVYESFFTATTAADIRSGAATDDTFTVAWSAAVESRGVAASLGLLVPVNTTPAVIDQDGLISAGTWDSFTNGTATFTYQWEEYLADQWEEVDGETNAANGPSAFSVAATHGRSYRLMERGTNDGGFDVLEDTPSNTVVYDSGGGSALPAIAHHYRQLMSA